MKKFHFQRNRLIAALLALVCLLGLLPTAAFAAGTPGTIKMDDCTHNGVKYESPALGTCHLHQMHFGLNGKSTMGFCAEKGKGMGWSLEGQTWGNPQPITDPTVTTMMAYFYAHSTGNFTDQAHALGVDDVWDSGYTWTMNAWVQAIVWRYKAGLLSDPVIACAEELLCVYNNLEHTSYTSIDDTMDGRSFRDRAQYILDLGAQGVWGECTVSEYKYTGSSTSYHQASDVQAIMIGELNITREKYDLTVKKVDSTNPNKGLSGARFKVTSENGSYSKEIVTGSDGTYTLSGLDAGTYAVTELEAPEGYEIDNAGPQYVVLPNGSNTTVTVTFTDTPEITGEGSIRKVDADNPTKGLAGAVIEIVGVDNDFTGTYVTGEGGYLTDVPWKDMPIGSYTATEVTPPEGYTKSPETGKVKQSFRWDGKTDVALVFENDAKVKIKLVKLDDSDNPLPGAVFNIIKDGQIIGTEATKADGSITVTDVTEGMYAFVEVSAPAPYQKYADELIILLGTGLRISEFCGLTTNLDFKNRLIQVDHQLLRDSKIGYYIETPKTKNGYREIPMSEPVYRALKRVLKNRGKKATITVDGYTNFLFLKEDGTPKVGINYNSMIKGLVKKYNKQHKEQLPNITPHSLRHTFCTRMANAGMNPKALQYIMGHANITMTLDYYTHVDACSVKEEMERLAA